MTLTTTVPVGALIPSLARWGLSSDADLVFRTLATFGRHDARTLAADLGLTRHRVESALAELHECGAVVIEAGSGRQATWVNRPPDEVVNRLRRRRLNPADPSRAARRHQAVVNMINERLAGVGLPLDPAIAGPVGDQVRYLPTRALARQRIAQAWNRERHEHLVINNEEVETADVSRVQPITEELFNGTISYRILGQPPSDGDTVSVEREQKLPGYAFRETPDTPLKLFICDRRTAFLPADPANLERGYLEVTHRGVIGLLVELFEARWTAAVDPDAYGVPMILLSTRERALVDLLAAGHTDVTAAEELRISARSVTNALRALMDRLGVDNRFQLGLALGAMDVAAPPSLR